MNRVNPGSPSHLRVCKHCSPPCQAGEGEGRGAVPQPVLGPAQGTAPTLLPASLPADRPSSGHGASGRTWSPRSEAVALSVPGCLWNLPTLHHSSPARPRPRPSPEIMDLGVNLTAQPPGLTTAVLVPPLPAPSGSHLCSRQAALHPLPRPPPSPPQPETRAHLHRSLPIDKLSARTS